MIHVNHISKTFHEGTPKAFQALSDISLHVNKNETVLLKGISGSGKSTLLSLIAGLYQPTHGEIIIQGERISHYPENFASRFRRNHIGFIFQKFHLVPTLTALENIVLPTLPDASNPQGKALKLLASLQMKDKASRYVFELSGGEQQRVAIARALINDPDIILADEPTANLDQALSHKLLEYFEGMQKTGKTLLIATHDPLLLEWGQAQRCCELTNGIIV